MALMHHTTALYASELRTRCIALGVQATGHELQDQHLIDILDLGIDRPDLSDLLAEFVDRDVDGQVDLEQNDAWEDEFLDAISAQ